MGDASSGSSIARFPDGWQIAPVPTPNDCAHAL